MKKKVFKILICIHIVYCLIFEFDLIKAEILSVSDMWFRIILPSVFPYLVLSRYLAESDIADIILKLPGKFLSRILRISYPAMRCVLCSLICGYPSGAITASALEKGGAIDKSEAEKVIYYSNNAGPLFLISAVGGAMLRSQRLGFAIYIIQLISAFIYGIMIRKTSLPKKALHNARVKTKFDLCTAVAQSVTVVINIFGFMATAFIMSRICIILLGKFIPMNKYADILIKGFFEISAGVREASGIENQSLSFALICAFVSWSGLSVILQIISASHGLANMKKLIYAKFIQGIISFGLGYAYITLSKAERGISGNDDIMTVSAICGCILFIIYILKSHISKKEHSR